MESGVEVNPVDLAQVLGIGGGWAFGVGVVSMVLFAFFKGWIVTGKALQNEIERSKTLNETNENLMGTVNTYAASVREMINVNRPAIRALSALQELPPAGAKENDPV